jgi:hypothetical protein
VVFQFALPSIFQDPVPADGELWVRSGRFAPVPKLQSEVVRKTAIWVSLARFEMLNFFGTIEEQTAAIDRHFRLIETNITMSNP